MEPSRKKMRMTLRSGSKIPAPKPFPQPPRFKLQKLPLLAQIEVIKSMTRPEQYLLSKCSRRASQMVIISMPKNNNHEIWVEVKRNKMQYYLKIAGSTVLIHTSSGKFSLEEHKHICDLFRAPPEVYVIWEDFDSFSENFSTNVVKKSNLLKYQRTYGVIEEFPDLHHNQDLILMDGQHTNFLKKGHSFLGARNLMLSSTKLCPYRILWSFEGEHLLMEGVQFSTFYIQVFVDKWMKKKNDKLKTVVLQLAPESVFGSLKYDKFSFSVATYHNGTQKKENEDDFEKRFKDSYLENSSSTPSFQTDKTATSCPNRGGQKYDTT
ncbi:hypothetical protein CAEBREN_23894 [Caenorhabditis brenneri]|uniref:F-box domain-containing protein n=1 Tax=Caenorhabditis brenneri TaxID=135651 RepID=G0PHZ7_CAEBE|nr:hypothetical protein CAEBREN_23894 [Caenorhabditis brenneri]